MKFLVVSTVDASQKFWGLHPNSFFFAELRMEISHKLFDSLEDVFFALGRARRAAAKRAGNSSCLSEFIIKSFYTGVDMTDPDNVKFVKAQEAEEPMPDNHLYDSFIYGKSSDGKFVRKIAQIIPVRN